MKNEELIKALRYHADATIHDCDGCPYQTIHKTKGICLDRMISDAADAIEATDRLLDQNIERCEELRKQLREAHESYEKHLNELEQQIPKHGEWEERYIEEANPLFRRRFYCSRCGEWTTYGKTRYCPNCGAKMDGEVENDG